MRHKLGILLKPLRPLNRKLVRDIGTMWGQVLAVSLVVACGVGIYVMMHGTLVSLKDTLAAYYSRYYMADVWAPVRRAPLQQVDRIAAIKGVKRVEGRISAGALLDMPGESEPVRGLIVSMPEGKKPRINSVHLERGRMPAFRSEEVLVARDFMNAHHLKLGDQLDVTLYGVKRRLMISGVALAPEFIYSIAPGEMIPNPRSYAIMWMGYDALAHAYDMGGAFNEAVMVLERGAQVAEVLRQVDLLLEPYGASGAYHRDDQLSDEFLQSEFTQLSTLGGLLPPIFLGVAAFLLNMIITRIVEQEREQIGLMKAFGYRPSEIIWHYVRLAVVIVLIGVLAGFWAGTSMGGGMANIFKQFYKFPVLNFDAGVAIYIQAAFFALVAGMLGVLLAVRKAVNLRPAVAMSPPVPTDYSGLGRIGAGAKWMDQGLRLIVRHIVRWPARSALTTLGIALGMAIMVGAQGSHDAIQRMISLQFDLVSRQDITVAFAEPQDRAVLHELAAQDGVMSVEPFLALPATFSLGHHRRHQGLTGVVMDAKLNVLLNESDEVINPAPRGLTLSEALANALEATPGDLVEVRFKTGKRKQFQLPVMNIVSTYLGTPAYMEMNAMNLALEDGERVSGAYLNVDEDKLDALYVRLKDMPTVAAVNANKSSKIAMKKTMDQTLGTMTFFNTLFASLIAVGVVFSSARISFYERKREIASLRVLGFTVLEVNAVLLGELAVLTFAALPVGAFLGYQLALYIATNMSSELFRVPTIVSNWTIGYATSVIVIAAVLSAAVIARQVAKLDMVVALKTRE